MSLDHLRAITDVCILVEDIERTIEFYEGKLGFRLRRKADGFADFHGDTVAVAAWQIDHIHEHTGVSGRRAPVGAHKACIAVNLPTKQILDDIYKELSAKGVPFQAPPRDYMWNAYCAYFTDPDDTLWELYVWGEGGPEEYHDISNV